MKWNVQNIAFLYPPDVFTGAFDNDKMETKHREEVQKKLDTLKKALTAEDDPLAAMLLLHKKDQLQFLHNNIDLFQLAERLEEAVIILYTRLNTPFSSDGDTDMWNGLFETCDRKKLYDYGSPVTFSFTTIYRGSVTGNRKSLIWTPEKKTVERMAKRWEDPQLGGGYLYEIDVKKDDVLVFLKLRRGNELILSPQCIKSATIRDYTA